MGDESRGSLTWRVPMEFGRPCGRTGCGVTRIAEVPRAGKECRGSVTWSVRAQTSVGGGEVFRLAGV